VGQLSNFLFGAAICGLLITPVLIDGDRRGLSTSRTLRRPLLWTLLVVALAVDQVPTLLAAALH
jgi:hypothetical protein